MKSDEAFAERMSVSQHAAETPNTRCEELDGVCPSS